VAPDLALLKKAVDAIRKSDETRAAIDRRWDSSVVRPTRRSGPQTSVTCDDREAFDCLTCCTRTDARPWWPARHILHAGDVFAVDLRNAPHVLAPGLKVVLGQPPAHGLAGDIVVLGDCQSYFDPGFNRSKSLCGGTRSL
jgi:hypothetical protein